MSSDMSKILTALLVILSAQCCSLASSSQCSLVGTWYGTSVSGPLAYQQLFRIDNSAEQDGLVVIAVTLTPKWGTGLVNFDDTASTVTMMLDDQEIIHGQVSENCTKITWINPASLIWLKNPTVDYVHIVFMNHLDVGYASFIGSIINEYFQTYFPRAIRLAEEAELVQPDQSFIYTTHPWLISLYLDCPPNLIFNEIKIVCPSEEEIAAFTASIKKGHIAWHAGPMNMQIELMNEAVLDAGLAIAIDLDRKFGHSSQVLSQRDVPGMTAAAIPTLVKNGVVAVSVGVNPASAPPAVPKIFNWNDDIIGIWHGGGYPNNPGTSSLDPKGLSLHDCAVAPGTGHALCFAFRTDNTGPPTSLEELRDNYNVVQGEFPFAKVFASTLDQFVQSVDKSALPVVHGEIGDTWIQGVSSDPLKISQYRSAATGFLQCKQDGKCSLDDPVVFNTSRFLIKLAEHTWGLPGIKDFRDWLNSDFQKSRNLTTYVSNENSWKEQREFMKLTLETSAGHPLHDYLTRGMVDLIADAPDLTDYSKVDPNKVFQVLNGSYSIGFDTATGSITNFTALKYSGEASMMHYATAKTPLGLFTYHTYNETDFEFMKAHYGNPGNPGFDKPGSAETAHPVSQQWPVSLQALYQSKSNPASFITHLTMADTNTHTFYGAPAEVWVTTTVSEKLLLFDLVWINKTATRLPEATMFSFYPAPQSKMGWDCFAGKVNSEVDMKYVVLNGSQYQHAVEYAAFRVPGRKLTTDNAVILTSTSPLVCPIVDDDDQWTPTPFPVPLEPLTNSIISGIAFNLHNNIWNTNYPLYYPFTEGDENYRAQFSMKM